MYLVINGPLDAERMYAAIIITSVLMRKVNRAFYHRECTCKRLKVNPKEMEPTPEHKTPSGCCHVTRSTYGVMIGIYEVVRINRPRANRALASVKLPGAFFQVE